MNTKYMPGFTAEASLSYRKYREVRTQREVVGEQLDKRQRSVVIPQRGGPGFEGLGNCISDCRDSHPTWSAALCRKACVSSPDGPPPPPTDPTNRDLSIGGCWAWYFGCRANPFGFFCGEVRDRCLADIRR